MGFKFCSQVELIYTMFCYRCLINGRFLLPLQKATYIDSNVPSFDGLLLLYLGTSCTTLQSYQKRFKIVHSASCARNYFKTHTPFFIGEMAQAYRYFHRKYSDVENSVVPPVRTFTTRTYGEMYAVSTHPHSTYSIGKGKAARESLIFGTGSQEGASLVTTILTLFESMASIYLSGISS